MSASVALARSRRTQRGVKYLRDWLSNGLPAPPDTGHVIALVPDTFAELPVLQVTDRGYLLIATGEPDPKFI